MSAPDQHVPATPTALEQPIPAERRPPGAVPITAPADQPAGSPAHPGARLLVSVHNGHCHRYGICQQEAPEVFHLRSDTRLKYDTTPPADQSSRVRQAARLCPMQAITVETR